MNIVVRKSRKRLCVNTTNTVILAVRNVEAPVRAQRDTSWLAEPRRVSRAVIAKCRGTALTSDGCNDSIRTHPLDITPLLVIALLKDPIFFCDIETSIRPHLYL